MEFIKYSKIFFLISSVLIIGSLVFLAIWGLNLGIEFTGGSILEINYQERPLNKTIESELSELGLGHVYIQPIGDQAVILRMKDINESTHQKILSSLRKERNIEELRFESIGPVIGKELKDKTIITIILALISILLYVAISFRKVRPPLKSWQYGVVAILALFHDVLIPLGDRKSTRLNSSHIPLSRMPSSA